VEPVHTGGGVGGERGAVLLLSGGKRPDVLMLNTPLCAWPCERAVLLRRERTT